MPNKHVGPVQVASGDGSNWEQICAWDTFPTGLNPALARGDTVYLQDGTYNGKTLTLAESGTTALTIKKATASGDHGSNTGWVQATMGSGYATFTGPVKFTTRYWNIEPGLLQPPERESTAQFKQSYNTPAPRSFLSAVEPYRVFEYVA